MGLLSALLGNSDERDGRKALAQLDKMMRENGAEWTVAFMASDEFTPLKRQFLPKSLVGHGGPLHQEFIAFMHRLQAKLEVELPGLAKFDKHNVPGFPDLTRYDV